MKFLFLILMFFTFGNSATILNGSCVESFYVNNNKIVYTTSDNNTYQIDYSDNLITALTLNLNKFYFDSNTNTCIPYLQSQNDNFMMSLTGLICGSLLASVILFRLS